MEIFRGAEQNAQLGAPHTLMASISDHYAMTSRQQDMDEMGRLFSLKRGGRANSASILAPFRYSTCKFGRVVDAVKDDILLIRALESINLTYAKREDTLSIMEGWCFARTRANMRKCSIFFWVYTKG